MVMRAQTEDIENNRISSPCICQQHSPAREGIQSMCGQHRSGRSNNATHVTGRLAFGGGKGHAATPKYNPSAVKRRWWCW